MYGVEVLAISTTVSGRGDRIVWLAGELDMGGYDRAVAALDSAIDGSDGAGTIIDLSGLRFIDAGGIRALVEALQRAQAAKTPLELRGAYGLVERVLWLCGLIDAEVTATPATEPASASPLPSES